MDPLFFEPILKRIRWGGRRLGSVLGKPIGGESDYAESWEVVDHGHDQSVISHGPWAGMTLSNLVQQHPQELFGQNGVRGQFPLLIKFLDATDVLSLQVHPDDEQAKRFDPDENGKSEAWIVLATEPESVLYAGLKDGVTAGELRAAVATGNVVDLLHTVQVQPGDCLNIPAGTVHAIGAGVLLAEIQQSSDLTFRLHDWGRLGADGQPRPLHIDDAIACTDFTRGPVNPVQPQGRIVQGMGSEVLCEQLVACEYFEITRYHIGQGVSFSLPGDDRFHVLMTIAGHGQISHGDDRQTLALGQSTLVPADRNRVEVWAAEPMTILDAHLPREK